jgi:DNA-directed RNA polymerase subunit RPC12/RpoP
MDLVNFQCGHCGRLMAVEPALLGQQVRCPHCEQAVLAPAAEAAPGTTPADPFAPVSEMPEEIRIPDRAVLEQESIFTSPELHSDAIFGGPPQGLVDFSQASPPTIVPPPAVGPSQTAAQASLASPPALSFHAETPAKAEAPVTQIMREAEVSALSFGSSPPSSETAAQSTEPDPLASAIPKPQIRPPAYQGGWVIALLIVPLISYSILATIAVIYLRFVQTPVTQQPHPLEMIPDLEGENPNARHVKKKVSVNFHGRQELELPPSLRTTLGQSIRVGDLEVTPLRVALRPIEFVIPGYRPDRSHADSLVLTLRLKNVSRDAAFHPLDPYFVRRWKEIPGESKSGMPFTYLTVGKTHFYGGPIGAAEREERRESIKGQKLEQELGPGEELETFICTSPDDGVREAVERASQPMLWRIQVRRGFVQTPNRGELSASAVIGVVFTREEVERPLARR